MTERDPPEGAVQARIRPATAGDVPVLLELLAEFARFARLSDQFSISEKRLTDALFGVEPAAEALIAESAACAVGYALFFPIFASFSGTRAIWLEDLYVRRELRGTGIGRALLAAVAASALERGAELVEWATLDWNRDALSFYRGLGASTKPEWIRHAISGEPLEALAAARK